MAVVSALRGERAARPAPGRRALRRAAAAAIAVAVIAWLGVGLGGGYNYVHSYDLYRGFPKPVTPAGVTPGTLHTVSFHSAAIGRTERYQVYLPPDYAAEAAAGRRFPVLYLLHGSPGKMTAFADVGAAAVRANVLIAEHKMAPMLLVMPAGRQGNTSSSDSEWANTRVGPWENFVLDVVHNVDSRFATLANRQHRGIAGDSEGAYAAANIALHHLKMFSVVESWSGYYIQTPTGVFAGATPAQLDANSPRRELAGVVPQVRRLGLRVWLYQGKADTHNPAGMEEFGRRLHAAGATVHIGFFPGGHDWGLWRAQMPRMLVAASRWFAHRPGHAGALRQTGAALTQAHRRRLIAARQRHCRRLHVHPGMHLRAACRAYRRSLGLPVR